MKKIMKGTNMKRHFKPAVHVAPVVQVGQAIRLKLIISITMIIFASTFFLHASDYSYHFLKSGLGARALGMGGTFAAICDDATAAVWNPAGLSQVDTRQAAMMYSNEFDMDIYLNYVGYVQPVSYFGSFGFTYAQLNTGFVPVTTTKDAYGRPIIERYMSNNESAFVLTWAKDMARRKASIGINVKFLSQTFDDNHGRGVDLDLGFLFKPTDNFSMGITFQDFLIGKMNWDGVDDNMALTVKTGIAGKFFNNRVVVGLDADFGQHRPVMWHIGSEYNLNKNFSLRFGSDDGHLTGGTSIKMKNWIFDYAYQDHDLGPTHRISARIDFDHEWPWRNNFRRRTKMRPLEPAKKVLVRIEEVDTTRPNSKVRVIEPNRPGGSVIPVAKPMVDSRTKLLKYYVDLAERYSVTAKYDEAIPIYKKILKIDPNRPDVLIKLGQAYKYKMDYVRANRVFGYIIKRYPSSPFREKAMSEMVGDSVSNMGRLKGEKLSLVAPSSTEELLKDRLFTESTTQIAAKSDVPEKSVNKSVNKVNVPAKIELAKATVKKQVQPARLESSPVKLPSKTVAVLKSANKADNSKVVELKTGTNKAVSISETVVANVISKAEKLRKTVKPVEKPVQIITAKVKTEVKQIPVVAAKTEKKTDSASKKASAQLLKFAINTAEKPAVQQKTEKPVTKSTVVTAAVRIPVAEKTKPKFNDDRLVSHYYKKGNEYYMNGDYSKAIVLYEKVLERRENSIGIRFILGNNYILDKRYEKARSMYEYIIKTNPTSKVGTRAKILLKKLDTL